MGGQEGRHTTQVSLLLCPWQKPSSFCLYLHWTRTCSESATTLSTIQWSYLSFREISKVFICLFQEIQLLHIFQQQDDPFSFTLLLEKWSAEWCGTGLTWPSNQHRCFGFGFSDPKSPETQCSVHELNWKTKHFIFMTLKYSIVWYKYIQKYHKNN